MKTGSRETAGGRPFRGVLVGFGNAAVHAHLPAWAESDRFRIDAVVDPSPERREASRRMLPGARVYADFRSLLSDGGVEFADICAPPRFHAGLVLDACRAGLHVFCEKPLMASSEDLKAIRRTAADLRRVVYVVNNWKYAPLWAKAFELIQEGRLGRLKTISLTVLRTSNSGGGLSDWRRCADAAGGGILLDHGWHHFYLILAVAGAFPLSLSAKMGMSAEGAGVEEVVDLLMRFPSAEARLHLTWRAERRRNHGEIEGDAGRLSIEDDHLTLSLKGRRPVRFDFGEALSGGSHHPQWMTPVISGFCREIENESARGGNIAEALQCARLVELAYRSQREGACFVRCDPIS